MHTARLWAALFIAVAAIGPTAAGVAANAWAAQAAAPLLHGGVRLAHALTLSAAGVMALGQPVVGAALFGALTADRRLSWRERLAAWALWAASEAVEVICKRIGVGGDWAPLRPNPDPIPPVLALAAAHVWPAFGRLLQIRLRGSFPSGHVLRLALAAGYLRRAPNWWLPAAAALAAGLVLVAADIHRLTEVAGGAALALTALALAGRLAAPPRSAAARRARMEAPGMEALGTEAPGMGAPGMGTAAAPAPGTALAAAECAAAASGAIGGAGAIEGAGAAGPQDPARDPSPDAVPPLGAERRGARPGGLPADVPAGDARPEDAEAGGGAAAPAAGRDPAADARAAAAPAGGTAPGAPPDAAAEPSARGAPGRPPGGRGWPWRRRAAAPGPGAPPANPGGGDAGEGREDGDAATGGAGGEDGIAVGGG